MSKQEIHDYLSELDVCKVCILRFMNGRCNEYEHIAKTFEGRGLCRAEPKAKEYGSIATDEIEPDAKRSKSFVCIACLGIFQNDIIDTAIEEIIENTDLHSYECDTIYTSISVPILVQIRELALWIALHQQFPHSISDTQPPNISIKEIFKYLMNTRLCMKTNRSLEQNQDGILVNVFFDHENETDELERLKLIYPKSLEKTFNNKKKSQQIMTRNAFDKHFFPENLNLSECVEHLPVPPNFVSSPIKLIKCTISGPTIFVAGRYRKLSRELSQSPWILGGKRVMADSVSEIIAREIAPYFSVDPVAQVEQINFMSSGREDIDVRCLGKGRPFVLELVNSKKSTLPLNIAADMELAVDKSKKVSVQHLQLVKRDELVHIKTGEEKKQKMYRALCLLKEPATLEIMHKLDIPNGFLVQQMTPLRVLHRRPFLTRPRQVYSLKGFVHKENPKILILDVVTQAGTYIKELVHGEFGRTRPSISLIIGQEIDIVALDVNGIDLDWPPEIDNKSSLCEAAEK